MKTENKVSHTPGPWELVETGNGYRDPMFIRSNAPVGPDHHLYVCEFRLCPSDEHHKANAALIAAAPELLEALKTAQVRIFMLEGNSDEYKKIGNILDKAEGGK